MAADLGGVRVSRSVGAAGPPTILRAAGSVILGVAGAVGGLLVLLGTGRGDPRLFEAWPLLAMATLGLAAAVAVVLFRRTGRSRGSPVPAERWLRRFAADLALLLLVTVVLGATVVVAWVAIGGVAVFQGPSQVARTQGLLIAALLALFAAAVGAVVGRFRSRPITTDGLVALGLAAWVGELLVLFVVGPLIADEFGRGVGVVVSTWVVATAGVIQPVAFVLGGLLGRHLRPDRVSRPVAVALPPDDRFRNGFVVHEHTDVPDFPLVDDFAVEVEWADSLGVHMRWTSASLGPLTWFPWWDHLELDDKLMDPEHPPVGTREDPFYDTDQGWEFYAWDDGVHVFVATGEDIGQIDGAYRVPREQFVTAWRDGVAAIRAMRPATRSSPHQTVS